MDKNKFFTIVEKIYNNSKDFWEAELPEKLNLETLLGGKNSVLSSLELVTFLAELETELLMFDINISFLDKIVEYELEDISFNTLYCLINK